MCRINAVHAQLGENCGRVDPDRGDIEMIVRAIFGTVLLLAGVAICGGLLLGIFTEQGSQTLIGAGIPGVLIAEVLGISTLCIGAAILAHRSLKRRRGGVEAGQGGDRPNNAPSAQ